MSRSSTAPAGTDRPTRRRRREILLATMGLRPAVITIALDLLLADGRDIREVAVVHTQPARDDPGHAPVDDSVTRLGDALARLDAEFPDGSEYAHAGRPCRFRRVPLEHDGRPIHDVDAPAEAAAVFRALYREVRQAKRHGDIVHLCIAGGRKSMTVYGMAVAQLLFDPRDRLWHVLSRPALKQREDLHLRSPAEASLVQVPVLSLGLAQIGPVAELLADGDPVAAIEQQRDWMDGRRRQRCEAFLKQALTEQERRQVMTFLRLVVGEHCNPSSQELARQLVVAERTVRNRFSEIYAKLREHFGLHGEAVDSRMLVALLAPYYDELIA